MLELTLPYPPSANTYYRAPNIGKLGGRHLISAQGRAYREAVKVLCWQLGVKPLKCRLSVKMVLYPPDHRRRDLDNCQKPALDALTAGGIWGDDSQIDELHTVRGPVIKGGKLVVLVQKYDDAYQRLLANAAFLQEAAQNELQ